MQEVTQKLFFASDYQEGCLPQILDRLTTTNMEHAAGYGLDPHSKHARELIRTACGTPEAEIQFLVGGTQANEVTIACALHPWQAVVAATSGHVSVHEAGAIEAGGHKVIELPQREGKINAQQVEACAEAWETDGNRDHMIQPGMVYVSQPTECGTLYTRAELEALSAACHAHGMLLYVDGARLAYALAAPENDVTLTDLGRLCDAFYIGGTKCGALFGEAVVVPHPSTIPHFFTQIKQHGALVAKGFVTGKQFEVLFEDGPDGCLYQRLGAPAIAAAQRIKAALAQKGIPLAMENPTNQTFLVADQALLQRLDGRVEYGFWERVDEDHTIIRFATSWATDERDVDALLGLL
jgi:threonine aldolase